jgi:hypothetical protein
MGLFVLNHFSPLLPSLPLKLLLLFFLVEITIFSLLFPESGEGGLILFPRARNQKFFVGIFFLGTRWPCFGGGSGFGNLKRLSQFF